MRRSMPAIADGVRPIGLDELELAAGLLERVDVKYLVPLGTVAAMIDRLRGSHRVLTIDGAVWFEYRNTYFDSPSLTSFREHVQGRRRRFKCRSRLYVGSGEHAFEVKLKGLRGQTVKRRLRCEPLSAGLLGGPALGFLRDCLAEGYGRRLEGAMAPVLAVGYHRLTLAAPSYGERVTCDVALGVRGDTGREGRLREGFAIVEAKSTTGRSAADRALRALGARPIADCSKYCLGIGLTRPGEPANRFRPLMRRYFTAA
jgi:hypothetical protein